jgi:hypothetical protein
MKIRPSIIGGAGPLRLRTIHRAENIASALKRGVNVCQRQFVNEVLGPLVTEFIRNFGGEDATPIQHAFPTAAFSITSRLVKLVGHWEVRHPAMGHSMRDSAQVTAPGAVTSMIVAVSTRPNRQNRSTRSRMSVPLVQKQKLRVVNR